MNMTFTALSVCNLLLQLAICACHLFLLFITFVYMCHRHGKGIRKETKRFGAFIVFGVLAWMPADMQMNHGSYNAHAQWFSHWKMRADDHDILI